VECSPISAFQLFSFSAFQLFSFSAFQLFLVGRLPYTGPPGPQRFGVGCSMLGFGRWTFGVHPPKFVSLRVIRVKMLSPLLAPFCGH
jgi:hypothetical protein